MSREELLKALVRQQEQELDDLRRNARERLESLRREAAARLRLARTDMRNLRRRSIAHLREQQLCERERAWRREMTAHRWELAASCREVAARRIRSLWTKHRREILVCMEEALPETDWSRIRVAKDDVEAAHTLFPGITVSCDELLTGGLIAECRERGLEVDCSIATCLERLWPTLLPRLLEDIAHACRTNQG